MYFKDITEGGFCQENQNICSIWRMNGIEQRNKTGFCGKEACDVLSVEYYFCSAKVDGEAVVPCPGMTRFI